MPLLTTILKKLKNNPNVEYINSIPHTQLKKVLLEADTRYYDDSGESLFSDEVYDMIKDIVVAKDPAFGKALGHNALKVDGDGAKVKLPVWMGSMDKKKTLSKELKRVIISDKLDGISCLVHLKKGMPPILYTRGNGEYGRNISHLVQYFNNIDTDTENELMIRGELLLKTKIFEKYRKDESNARNTVAGFVNSKEPEDKFKNQIDFVAYELIKPSGLTPSEQFEFIKSKTKTFQTVTHEFFAKISDQQMLSETLSSRKRLSEYEIDGIIVADDKSYKNVTSGNPKHAFAYKENSLEKRVITHVTQVEWNISKDGYLKPLVYFEPVTIDNVKIQKATGHNAKFIQDNRIGKGSQIVIERSGDVIPKIVSVLVSAPSADMPSVKFKWNKTNTDIISDSSANKDDLKRKQFEFILTSLKFDHLGKGVIAKLYDSGVLTLKQVYSLSESDLLKIDGFKQKSAQKLYNSIQKRKAELTCLDYMVASNLFGRGMSKKNLEKVITKYDPLTTRTPPVTVEQIEKIDGIGKVYAKQYVEALPSFEHFLIANDIKCSKQPVLANIQSSAQKGTKLESMNIIFTGFRDKDMEECVKNQGGNVTTSLSKSKAKISILVCKELDATNSKIVKAREYNITIMIREEFAKKFCA
jgi:DNA ligase (NAD+)